MPRWALLLVIWSVLVVAAVVWLVGWIGLQETAEYVCLGSAYECQSLSTPFLGLFTAMFWVGLAILIGAVAALLLERLDTSR